MTGAATAEVSLLADIRNIVGERGLLSGDDVSARSSDPFEHVPVASTAIVRPATTGELSAVLKACHAVGQPIVTHGGRTGVTGGARATADELVVSLERMARILEIDPATSTMTVEAGVSIEAVQTAAAAQGLFYPIDLGSKGSATVGGTIATNAGGNRVIRWGMTRANILGLEAVLADGTTVSTMNRFLKNNSGYDLKQLFIGSEGTLGIVTGAVLRLVPAPATQNVAFVSVRNYPDVLRLLALARHMQQLSAFEVMWRDYYSLVAGEDPERRPVKDDQPFYILIEAMGDDETADRAAFERLLERADTEGLLAEAVLATSGAQVTGLWRVREASEILVRRMWPFLSFDVSVDIRDGDRFVTRVRRELAGRFDSYEAVTFGHLGDGNIHLGVHIGPDTLARGREIEGCVYDVLAEFGGALTAEHGIGTLKRAFLPDHVGPAALDTMRRLRAAIDPARLLNRHVLFED